jgi:iron complex transport system substrate-binding protein
MVARARGIWSSGGVTIAFDKPLRRREGLTPHTVSLVSIPRRIICLSAETVDMLDRLGAGDLIVGVSAFARCLPAAQGKEIVCGFTTFRYEAIESLQPDLVIGFSDLQADALCELCKRGYPVLLTNQRTLDEMFATLEMIGRVVGKANDAETLSGELKGMLHRVRQANERYTRRPKVYFEEWDDPLVSGIAWIGELIAAAGGDDVFAELGQRRIAPERVVQCTDVVERAPDIIVASWCGKRVDFEAIRARPGWEALLAVRNNQLYEIESDYCLQPGPVLITTALPRFEAIIAKWRAGQAVPDTSSQVTELSDRA